MVLAAFGIHVAEDALQAQARMEEGGTPIEELARLGRQYGLVAEIQEATTDELQGILTQERLPITYLDRAVFDLSPSARRRHSLRHAKIHAVVPTRVTRAYVTFHDPLPPCITRKSVNIFSHAHALLGNYCVVCSKRE
jgi:hypothetical protein